MRNYISENNQSEPYLKAGSVNTLYWHLQYDAENTGGFYLVATDHRGFSRRVLRVSEGQRSFIELLSGVGGIGIATFDARQYTEIEYKRHVQPVSKLEQEQAEYEKRRAEERTVNAAINTLEGAENALRAALTAIENAKKK